MAKKSSSKGIGLDVGMAAAPKMNKSQLDSEMRYRAESDMRTMHEAHAIMIDKKRMATVEKVMHESVGVMQKMKSMAKK